MQFAEAAARRPQHEPVELPAGPAVLQHLRQCGREIVLLELVLVVRRFEGMAVSAVGRTAAAAPPVRAEARGPQLAARRRPRSPPWPPKAAGYRSPRPQTTAADRGRPD